MILYTSKEREQVETIYYQERLKYKMRNGKAIEILKSDDQLAGADTNWKAAMSPQFTPAEERVFF